MIDWQAVGRPPRLWGAGGIVGAGFGIVFGGLLAIAAARGDPKLHSHLPPTVVFIITLVGWGLSGLVAGGLSSGVLDRTAASLVGVIAAIPLTTASVLVACAPSDYLSVGTAVVFTIVDLVLGLVGAEIMWQQYHPSASQAPKR